MTYAKRNSGRAAGAAALVALVFLSACSQAPKRGSAAGYKIGAMGARLSASAADPGAPARPQARAQAQAARRAAKAAPASQGRAASATSPVARAGGAAAAEPGAPVATSSAAASVASGMAAQRIVPVRTAAAPPSGPSASPLRLDRLAVESVRALPPMARDLRQAAADAAPWSWLAAILAGFAAALALAWALRPRGGPARVQSSYAPPAPANDRGEPHRAARRTAPPPPKVTILAKAGGR